MYDIYFFFFFQAEDGIRDPLVTGVQTCALPIYLLAVGQGLLVQIPWWEHGRRRRLVLMRIVVTPIEAVAPRPLIAFLALVGVVRHRILRLLAAATGPG